MWVYIVSANKNIFFVTGLPRSRTAWVANYLTYGNTFCFHDEAFAHCATVQAVADRLAAMPFENVGCANPLLLLFVERLQEIFPQAKWLFIRRDKQAVIESWCASGTESTPEFIGRLDAKLNALWQLPNSASVAFNDLDLVIRQRAEWLAPGFSSPAIRDTLLRALNVQVTMVNVVKGMTQEREKYPESLYEEGVL